MKFGTCDYCGTKNVDLVCTEIGKWCCFDGCVDLKDARDEPSRATSFRQEGEDENSARLRLHPR